MWQRTNCIHNLKGEYEPFQMLHEAQLQPTASGGMFFVIITDHVTC